MRFIYFCRSQDIAVQGQTASMATLSQNLTVAPSEITNEIKDLLDIEYEIFLVNGLYVFVFLTFLLLVGIIGNIHVVIIYHTRYRLSNVKVFILALAVSDLCFCLTTIPVFMFDTRRNLTYSADGICQISRWLSSFLFFSSVLIQTFVAVERYKKVCRPFSTQWKTKQVIKGTTLIFITSAVVCSPILGQYGNIEKKWPNFPHVKGGRTCGATERFQSMVLQIIIFGAISICLIIVIVLYSLILKKIIKRNMLAEKRRSNSSLTSTAADEHSQSVISAEISEELRSTENPNLSVNLDSTRKKKIRDKKIRKACKISVMFLFVFIFSYIGVIPMLSLGTLRAVKKERFSEVRKSIGQLMDILLFSGLFNYVVNPVVYFAVDQKYRQHVRQLYGRIRMKNRRRRW